MLYTIATRQNIAWWCKDVGTPKLVLKGWSMENKTLPVSTSDLQGCSRLTFFVCRLWQSEQRISAFRSIRHRGSVNVNEIPSWGPNTIWERWVQRPESKILTLQLERLFSGWCSGKCLAHATVSHCTAKRHWVSTTLDPLPAISTKGIRLKIPAFQAGSPAHKWDWHQRQDYAPSLKCSSPGWVGHWATSERCPCLSAGGWN